MSKQTNNGFIKELKVQAGKTTTKEQSLKLALHDGQSGSGLTLVIGRDQAGRESVIQSLHRVVPAGGLVCMPPFLHVQKRQPPGEAAAAVHRFKQAPDEASKYTLLFDALAEVWHNADYKQAFNRLLKQCLPDLGVTWELQEPRSATSTFDFQSRERPPMEFLQTGGILPFFYVCLHLIETAEDAVFKKKNPKAAKVLLINEPEKYLPSFGLAGLAEAVSDIASRQQVVVCTLAGQMIRWQNYVNGARVIILGLDSKKQHVFMQLQSSGVYSALTSKHGAKWQEPEVIDAMASQMLVTAESALIAESQPEFEMIEAWEKETGLKLSEKALSGYLADEPAKMKFLLAIAADLGIRKVAAVYGDGPKSVEALKKDQKQFGQDSGWQFTQLTANETAEAKCAKCPDGCRCNKPKGLKRLFGSKTREIPKKASEAKMQALINYFK